MLKSKCLILDYSEFIKSSLYAKTSFTIKNYIKTSLVQINNINILQN